MPSIAIIFAIMISTPIWGQVEYEDHDLPFNLELEYGNRLAIIKAENQIFNFRLIHDKEEVRQIDMDWAVFSSGDKYLNDNWWAGISAQFIRQGFQPDEKTKALMYLQIHHRQKKVEARFYLPMAAKIKGDHLYPWVEIEKLEITRKGSRSIFLRADYHYKEKISYEFGISQKIRNFEFRLTPNNWSVIIQSDLNK